jgi:hypothetical protein
MNTPRRTITALQCWLAGSVIGLTVVGLIPQSASAQASARAGRAVVLQTLGAGQFVFELAIAQCRRSECLIEVRLRSGGRVVDRVALPVAAKSQRARAEIVDAVWGADPGLKAWAIGEENS